MTTKKHHALRRIGLGATATLLALIGVAYGTSGGSASDASGDGHIFTTGLAAHAAHEAPLLIDYARLDARLSQLMREPDMVGLAVGVVEGGKIRFVKGYGLASADGQEAVTANTVFRWASLSKGVAGTLVAELAREGAVSLDAPVSDYRTSLRLPGGAETRVTVADVLSHRVGVVRNAYDEKLEEGQDPRLIRASLATLPQYCAPRTCYTYQNIAFDAVTEVAEHATGRPYGALAREHLFAPLGMGSASIGRAGLERAKSWARPHRGRRVLETKDAYYRVPAAGGVNSSIFDLAKWMRAQMGAGVLPPALLDTVQSPRVQTPPKGYRGVMDRALSAHHYGLGWRLLQYEGHELVGHRGAVDGYRSLILFDPRNSNKPVGAQLEVFDMLYRLPPTDWLQLGDEPMTTAAAEAQATGSN